MDIPKQFGILLLENNYGGYIGTITAVMAARWRGPSAGVSDDVRWISYRAAARGPPLRWIGGEIFVGLRKENQGSPFPFSNGFRGMHLGSHNQFHVKLIREIDDFVECLARAFDFLWFIDFITTSKCKVLRTELLSAWFSEFF